MNQSLAVWLLIALALATANLPFLLERPFLVLPWGLKGEVARPAWWRWLESLIYFSLLIALAYAALMVIGRAFVTGSDAAATLLFLAKLVGVFIAAAVLLSYPGWRNRGRDIDKPFAVRLLEVLTFYGLVGTLGLAFEANIGSGFTQAWEFYAITLCLFVVLGYPGFVYRYLLRRARRR